MEITLGISALEVLVGIAFNVNASYMYYFKGELTANVKLHFFFIRNPILKTPYESDQELQRY